MPDLMQAVMKGHVSNSINTEHSTRFGYSTPNHFTYSGLAPVYQGVHHRTLSNLDSAAHICSLAMQC